MCFICMFFSDCSFFISFFMKRNLFFWIFVVFNKLYELVIFFLIKDVFIYVNGFLILW